MVHAKNSLNFTFKVIAIIFWNALCDATGCDFSKKLSPLFLEWNMLQIVAICRDLPRFYRQTSLVGPDGLCLFSPYSPWLHNDWSISGHMTLLQHFRLIHRSIMTADKYSCIFDISCIISYSRGKLVSYETSIFLRYECLLHV